MLFFQWYECFLLVNEKYNPITKKGKPCTPKAPILKTVGWAGTRGEPYREDLKQEVRALGFGGVTWPVSPGVVPVYQLDTDLAPEVAGNRG